MVKVYRNFFVINFLVLLSTQLHGMESNWVMDKLAAPTNVEVPTLKNILLQKCCQEIRETLEQKGIRAVEQLPYLDTKKPRISQDLQQDIQQAYVQFYGLYQKTKVLPEQKKDIHCMAYDAQHDRLFLGFSHGRIGVSRASNGVLIQKIITGSDDAVTHLVYDAKHNRLFSAYIDGSIGVWDMVRGEQINTLTGHTVFITCLLYDQEGDQLFSGSRDQTVSVWDMLSGIRTHVLIIRDANAIRYLAYDPIRHLAYDSRHKRLFCASGYRDDRDISIWDIVQGTRISTITMPDDIQEYEEIWGLAYDVQHDRLITGFKYGLDGDQYIDVWNVENGKRMYRLSTNDGAFDTFVYDPHHTRLFLWGNCANLEIWNMATIVRRTSPYNKDTNYDYGLSKCIQRQVFKEDATPLVCTDTQHNRLFLVPIFGSCKKQIIEVWELSSFAYALCKRAVDKVKTCKDLWLFLHSTSYQQLSDIEQQELKMLL